MGKYKGLNISGGLAANFKKLRVKKTIAVTELLDRGHVYEGRSDLPTKGAGHRRGRGAEKSNRKGARGATRGSIDLGYVSGDGSNVVVNEDYGLLTENAVPLGQAIKETRRQAGVADSQAEASTTPPAAAVSGTIFQVTVGPKTGGGNAFYINGVEAPALTIVKPGSYIFSQVDPSNVGHPLRFSLDGGVTEHTTGVTSHGTIGTVNSYVHIIVGNEDITGLSYYCTVHGQGMGNTIAEGSEVWTPPSASEETGGETGGGQSTPTPTIVSGSNETTIHITTDGGAGVNNSFADSSSNAYTITAGGTPQLNTFSPYRHGGYSTNFDGSDYITSPITAIGTGDFTAECWVYPTAFGQYGGVFSSSAIGAPTGISVSVDQWWLGSDTAYTTFVSGNKFTLNTWQHVAVVRNGTTVTGYVDGVAVGTAELATNLTSTSMAVGSRYQNNADYLMTGTVSDFRLVNSAVYTEAFTPPTERLTAITDTELLTCHLPYIADGSSNGYSITINGDPQTKPTSPYDRVGYSEDLHGGSVHFTDNTDRLSATVTAPGTGDFTMEAWVYFDTLTGNQSIMALGNYVPALYYRSATTEMAVYYSSGQPILQTGFTPKIGQWYHMAMVRESGTVKVYIDGKQEGGSATLSSNLTSTTLNIGYDGVDYFGGNLGDVRYSTSAVYTADFTPPAAPLESTGAELHIKGVEGHIIDKAQSGNNFTIVGNTTASTAESKYAGSSIYFDGGGDYIKLDGTFSEFFDNAWTIEFWVNLNSLSTSNAISIGDGSGVDGMYLLHGGNGFYLGSNGSWNISAYTSSTITVGQWHHCAVTWDGSYYRTFIDGALENTATSSAKLGPGPYNIGIGATYTGNQPTDGYIEDLRLTQGVARYTEAFTPPTESLATYSTTGGTTDTGGTTNTQHALYSSADLLVHYDFTDSTTTAGYISGSSVTDQQGNHNAVINTYNSATPTYEDGGLRTNSGTIIAGDWSMGTYPSHTAIIVTKYIGGHRAVMGAYDPPASDPAGYGKGFSIGKDDIFGRFDNGATYKAAEFTDLTAVANDENFVLGYVVDGANNTIYGWRNGEKSANTITLNSAITAPVFNTYEYGGVFAGGSSGFSTAAQYMTDSVIYKTFFFGRVLTDQEMSEFMDSLLEETTPQVTALQGSMTVGDTATIETTGVSKFTPTENFTATVKMWGAAGGNGTGSFGGRGGYTEGTYEFQAGTTYQILVGQGGKSNNGTSGGVDTRTGGGGRVGVTANGNDFRATGGGYTGLFDTTILQSNALLIAGGGGGGGPTGYPGTDANAGGGDGGGTTGTDGSNGGFAGGGPGGTQLAGGAAGADAGSYGGTVEAGSALLGGGAKATITENYTGSGGGGGYFGGGGGGSNNYAGGAGGGGSSYIHTSITNGQTISGAGVDNKTGTERGTVPGSTETEWNGTAGSQAATKAKEGEAPDGQITITVIDPNAQPSSSWYGDRGFIWGGINTSIFAYDITGSSVSSTTHGSLRAGDRAQVGAAASDGTTALLHMGNSNISGSTTREDQIEYISCVTAGNTQSFGNLSLGRYKMKAASDGNVALFGGGTEGAGHNDTIDYIGFSVTGQTATDFGNMALVGSYTARMDFAAGGDNTIALFIGGASDASSYQDPIQYVTIATPGNATLGGNLSVGRSIMDAASDATTTMILGGRASGANGGDQTLIDKITTQTMGTATSFGNLSQDVSYHSVSTNGDRAVRYGGYSTGAGGNVDNLDYVTFAAGGTATSFGTLGTTLSSFGQGFSGNAA